MSAPVRAEIAQSWKRARLSGLEPADSLDRFSVLDVDRRSRLLAAADPILDRMESVLRGSGYCVLLADSGARLVDMRYGTSGVGDLVSTTGAIVGRPFTEETSGTNSIATVFETRVPLAVRGDEHYMESMKIFSCYGYPLVHPITKRIEGVLDITFLTADDNPLLQPMLLHAAQDIQGRLLEETRSGEQVLFREFQQSSARRRGAPVVALADEILLENASAGRIVDAIDHIALRSLTDGALRRTGHVPRMTLSSGLVVAIRWERPESGAGIVVEIDPIDTPSSPAARSVPRSATSVCVAGEPGTGRTTRIRRLVPPTSVRFDGADLVTVDASEWFVRIGRALAGETAVVVENIDLLPAVVARELHRLLSQTTSSFAMSSAPADSLDPEHRRLITLCSNMIELVPLRSRRHDIPELVRDLAPGTRFTPAAMTALVGHDWPGNIGELKAEVTAAAARRTAGDVTEKDLVRARSSTDNGRSPGFSRACLTVLDTAMRDAIVRELDRQNGNKRRTADTLGISRTTLYKRMRKFGIPG